MKLTRCTDQAPQTIEEYYRTVIQKCSPSQRDCASAMLDIVALLRDQVGPALWLLTSHHRLCLLATDDWESPWYVIVDSRYRITNPKTGAIADRVTVEYLMPASSRPWPHAYVRGEAKSAREAVDKIAVAIERGGGWALCPPR